MKDILKEIFSRATILVCAIGIALTVSLPVYSEQLTPPPMPGKLEADAGTKLFFAAHAVGTQNYICLPSGWAFFGPQATLYQENDKQVATHFLSANPIENGTLRAVWQHSKDTSSVWAMMIETSSDPDYVAQGAIPWFKLRVVGAQDGPAGTSKLSDAVLIQRLNTTGGIVPVTGCSVPTDVGKKAMVPYTADYFFYKSETEGNN